jgi:hypothetical protein
MAGLSNPFLIKGTNVLMLLPWHVIPAQPAPDPDPGAGLQSFQ